MVRCSTHVQRCQDRGTETLLPQQPITLTLHDIILSLFRPFTHHLVSQLICQSSRMHFAKTLRTFASLSRTSLLRSSGPQLNCITRSPSIIRRTMASAMSQRLSGKTVVVTGASSGIGKSTGPHPPTNYPLKPTLMSPSNGIRAHVAQEPEAHLDGTTDRYAEAGRRRDQERDGRRSAGLACEAGCEQAG